SPASNQYDASGCTLVQVVASGQPVTPPPSRGDFDGDGLTDFTSANPNFDTWLAAGDGTFHYAPCGGPGATCTAPPAWCNGSAHGCLSGKSGHVTVGDFDGDGIGDFMSANGNFDVWRGKGDGTFVGNVSTPPPSFCSGGATGCLSGAPNGVVVGDFDG